MHLSRRQSRRTSTMIPAGRRQTTRISRTRTTTSKAGWCRPAPRVTVTVSDDDDDDDGRRSAVTSWWSSNVSSPGRSTCHWPSGQSSLVSCVSARSRWRSGSKTDAPSGNASRPGWYWTTARSTDARATSLNLGWSSRYQSTSTASQCAVRGTSTPQRWWFTDNRSPDLLWWRHFRYHSHTELPCRPDRCCSNSAVYVLLPKNWVIETKRLHYAPYVILYIVNANYIPI